MDAWGFLRWSLEKPAMDPYDFSYRLSVLKHVSLRASWVFFTFMRPSR